MKAPDPTTGGQGRLDTTTQDMVLRIIADAVPGLIAVYVFGSAGTQYERPTSDVDLAFLSARVVDPVLVWNISQAIAAQLGRDVDLVDLRSASTVMAAHIIAGGSQLQCGDKNPCAEFEAHTLSDYARLNEKRAGILQDIRARGSIHAR